jgi:hypothetical protein
MLHGLQIGGSLRQHTSCTKVISTSVQSYYPRFELKAGVLVLFSPRHFTSLIRKAFQIIVTVFIMVTIMKLNIFVAINYQSQWPRGLRRGSTAVRLLGLWVRIPPVHGYLSLVSIVCCQVEVSASG